MHRTEGTFLGSAEYAYDVRDNLTNLITTYGGNSVEQRYSYSENALSSKSATYAKDNLPTVYQLYDDRYAVYEYDSINRLNQRMFNLKNTPLYYNYIYKSSDRNGEGESLYRTHQISKEFIGNDVYVYSYDVLGNITSIKKAVRKSTVPTEADFKEYIEKTDYVTYTYDDLGQLTRENLVGKNTTVWNYDELGNITTKKEYSYTTEDLKNKTATKTITYGYGNDSKSGWENLLISVDLDGDGVGDNDEISYDKIGNPTTYLGATLAWNGRQLTNYTKGDTTVSYKYDADGLRTSKTVNGVTSKYFYINGQLHYEERTDGTKLYFFYDSNGYLSAIEYNGTNYYPATNKRGDVVAIYRYTGDLYAKYEYDAWGNVISVKNANDVEITSPTHIANVNPIRYRGYYYDTETELYYLQSRYYNAEVGRFLNADVQLNDDILGNNTFAYCGNNPVSRKDNTGTIWWIAASAVIGAVVGGASRVASNLLTGKKWYNGVVGSTIAGAVGGAIATTGHLATASYVSVALESTINEAVSYTEASWLSGSKQKTLTQNNIKNSCASVVKDTAIKGFFAYVTGNVFGGSNATFDISPTTSVAWNSVDVIVSALESVEVGLAGIGQDYTGEALSKKFGQIPKIQLYPETYVDESEEQ